MKHDENVAAIDSRVTYELTGIAQLLKYSKRATAKRNIIDAGCPHVRLGSKYFISGKEFQEWIESLSESKPVADDKTAQRSSDQ